MAEGDVPTAPFRDAPGGKAALLIVDMISTMDFDGAQEMAEETKRAADAIARLRDEADRIEAPVIYINDNFGEWHSEKSRLIERARKGGPIGRAAVEKVGPRDQDYFIIKPQFSGFYATNLPVLLPKLGVGRLILTGIAADVCILFTAGDAHMRDYKLWVPEDAVGSTGAERKCWALEIMRLSMGAETRPSDALALDDWLAMSGTG